VTPRSRREYAAIIRERYAKATREAKQRILDEFCATTKYHRKYAIAVLGHAPTPAAAPRRRRRPTYGAQTISVLATIWEAASYPWSARLKALLPLWLPWATRHLPIAPGVERQLRRLSARTMDRRLATKKRRLQRRFYGRTKPGTLLKHHIAIKTEHWEVSTPGFTEIDLVSHSGNAADGDFLQSLNLTDIHTGWVETRAVMGKGQTAVRAALEELRQALPFPLRGIDSDNGSEFINNHLVRYCADRKIQFTRGRPYKKDDNAHIEQKNYTHVRKLMGWERYDSPHARARMNDLYQHEVRLMMNLYQPSVKLLRKERIGSRLTRRYDAPKTPLDRLAATPGVDAATIRALHQLRAQLDPFALAAAIDQKLSVIHQAANHRLSPRDATMPPPAVTPSVRATHAPHRWDHNWFFPKAVAQRRGGRTLVRT